MKTPGSGSGATVSGSPGRAEQGVAGVHQQLLLQQQFINAQNVPVPPCVSSNPGNQGPVNQGQGFGMSYGVGQNETVTQVTRLLRQLRQVDRDPSGCKS